MPKTKLLVTVVFLLLGGALALALIQYNAAQNELQAARATIASQRSNAKALRFLQIFIRDVLKSSKEVDFETRLRLETAVRELDDQQILSAWQKFVNSKSEAEAQEQVKALLDILVIKAMAR